MDRRLLLGLVALLTVLLAACDDDPEEDHMATTPPATMGTATTPATTPPAAVTTSATPGSAAQTLEGPVNTQLTWVIEQINDQGRALTEDTVRERFTAEFLAAVPPAQTLAIFQQIGATLAPLTFDTFAQPPSQTQAAARYTARTGDLVIVNIAVEAAPPHRIAGLTIRPAPPDAGAVPLDSWDDLDRELRALAPRVSLLAAEVTGDTCRPVHALNSDQRLAIGSTFKLYILGELAHQVQTGAAAWDEQLAIRDDLKSLPSGTMQDEPAGTVYPLREYAARMISISDNTATDHLLVRLGREQVEAYQAAMGHGDPARNIPFLATHELFALKLVIAPDDQRAYLAASVDEQRRILATTVAQTPVTTADAAGWDAPRAIDTLEWFASADDLCRAMAALGTLAEQPGLEPVREILSINPGVPFDQATWPYIGFKGGSEPGVINLTWLLRRADSRWFALTLSLNNPDAAIDENAVIRLIGPITKLLAATE